MRLTVIAGLMLILSLSLTEKMVFKEGLMRLPDLHELRAAHSATLLPGGKVLIAAGFRKGPNGYSQLYSNTAEIYDPATRKFSYTGSMQIARCGQTATLLPGGDVLITVVTMTSPGWPAPSYTIAAKGPGRVFRTCLPAGKAITPSFSSMGRCLSSRLQ